MQITAEAEESRRQYQSESRRLNDQLSKTCEQMQQYAQVGQRYEKLQKQEQEDSLTLTTTLFNQVEEFANEFAQIGELQRDFTALLEKANAQTTDAGAQI